MITLPLMMNDDDSKYDDDHGYDLRESQILV